MSALDTPLARSTNAENLNQMIPQGYNPESNAWKAVLVDLLGHLAVVLAGSSTGKLVSATITRPSSVTAYTAGDVVSTTAGEIMEFANVGSANDLVCVLGASLRVDVAAVPSGCTGFRLHLYNAAPTVIADNAAYDLPSGDRGKYLGYIPISAPIDLGSTLYCEDDNVNHMVKLAGTSLYGILQTIGSYTPTASAVKTVNISVAGV